MGPCRTPHPEIALCAGPLPWAPPPGGPLPRAPIPSRRSCEMPKARGLELRPPPGHPAHKGAGLTVTPGEQSPGMSSLGQAGSLTGSWPFLLPSASARSPPPRLSPGSVTFWSLDPPLHSHLGPSEIHCQKKALVRSPGAHVSCHPRKEVAWCGGCGWDLPVLV